MICPLCGSSMNAAGTACTNCYYVVPTIRISSTSTNPWQSILIGILAGLVVLLLGALFLLSTRQQSPQPPPSPVVIVASPTSERNIAPEPTATTQPEPTPLPEPVFEPTPLPMPVLEPTAQPVEPVPTVTLMPEPTVEPAQPAPEPTVSEAAPIAANCSTMVRIDDHVYDGQLWHLPEGMWVIVNGYADGEFGDVKILIEPTDPHTFRIGGSAWTFPAECQNAESYVGDNYDGNPLPRLEIEELVSMGLAE